MLERQVLSLVVMSDAVSILMVGGGRAHRERHFERDWIGSL